MALLTGLGDEADAAPRARATRVIFGESYFFSIASILRPSSRLESISRRSSTNVRMMAMLTSTARGERSTLESMATPCSVKA
jgi:hypothetical protein